MLEQPASAASVHSCSRLDFIRMLAIDAIERWEHAPECSKPTQFMTLCGIQDQICLLKQRNPRLAYRPSRLGWADNWRPGHPVMTTQQHDAAA